MKKELPTRQLFCYLIIFLDYNVCVRFPEKVVVPEETPVTAISGIETVTLPPSILTVASGLPDAEDPQAWLFPFDVIDTDIASSLGSFATSTIL